MVIFHSYVSLPEGNDPNMENHPPRVETPAEIGPWARRIPHLKRQYTVIHFSPHFGNFGNYLGNLPG